MQREHDEAQLRHRASLGLQVNRLGIQAARAAGNDQQAAAANVRALLIPQRQLPRELRVLIDARFDLLRAVNQPGFGKVVDHRRAVVRAVAAPGNPANQVVTVEGRKGENSTNSRPASSGSFISTKFGCIACVVWSPPALSRAGFGGHRPLILAVVKHFRIGHVVEAVYLGLQRSAITRDSEHACAARPASPRHP